MQNVKIHHSIEWWIFQFKLNMNIKNIKYLILQNQINNNNIHIYKISNLKYNYNEK